MEQYGNNLEEPENYKDALSSEEAAKWRKAVDEEYLSLIENETWTLAQLPPNQIQIKCKWIFKIKPGHSSRVKKWSI